MAKRTVGDWDGEGKREAGAAELGEALSALSKSMAAQAKELAARLMESGSSAPRVDGLGSGGGAGGGPPGSGGGGGGRPFGLRRGERAAVLPRPDALRGSGAAARGRHGDDAKAAKRWAEKLCRLLEAGRMDDVLGAAPARRGSRGTRQGGPLPVRAARQVAFWQCACPEEVEKATSARRHVGNRRFLATEIADAAEP